MDRIDAAYALIVAEASERIKKRKGDFCGKLVDVTREIDHKIMHLMGQTRENERLAKQNKKNED